MHQRVQEKAHLRVSHPKGVKEGLRVQERKVRKALRTRPQKVGVRDNHAQAQEQRRNGMKKLRTTHLRTMAMMSSRLNIKKTMALRKRAMRNRRNSMVRSMMEDRKKVKKDMKDSPKLTSRWSRPSLRP